MQVKATTSVHAIDALFELPDSAGKTGRPFTKPSYRTKPVQAKQYAADLSEEAFVEVIWRQGSRRRDDESVRRVSSAASESEPPER